MNSIFSLNDLQLHGVWIFFFNILKFFFVDKIYTWIRALMICIFEMIRCNMSFQIQNINITGVVNWAKPLELELSGGVKFYIKKFFFKSPDFRSSYCRFGMWICISNQKDLKFIDLKPMDLKSLAGMIYIVTATTIKA